VPHLADVSSWWLVGAGGMTTGRAISGTSVSAVSPLLDEFPLPRRHIIDLHVHNAGYDAHAI
jgi:hypothetical protein